jgi:hypothetical protein
MEGYGHRQDFTIGGPRHQVEKQTKKTRLLYNLMMHMYFILILELCISTDSAA